MVPSILIVEDDLTFSTMLKTWLGKKGFEVETASTQAKARKQIGTRDFDLILSDLRLPDQDGLSLLSWLREQGNQVPFIIMTSYAEIQSAVRAMKEGATDYISKPVQPDELLKKIKEAIHQEKTPAESGKERNAAQTAHGFLEGESEEARKLYNYVGLVAPTQMSVLINGASGTGKEYVAHRIHQLSKRSEKPFIAIDCGSIPKDLAASEFFGHVKGSFTDAHTDRVGRFEAADGGTLFLDEIANLPYHLQAKLLTVIQKRYFIKVGSNTPQPTNIRLICATNRNLDEMVHNGEFREDLLYRINTIHLHIPALRERKEDILPLAQRFLEQYNQQYLRTLTGFSADAEQRLLNYPWHGNIRELQHTIEKAVILSDGNLLKAENLQLAEVSGQDAPATHEESKEDTPLQTLDEMEKNLVKKAIEQCDGNLSQAAAQLGITRQTLYNKMKRHGI